MNTSEALLELDGVGRTFDGAEGKVVAVDSVELTVAPGELVVLGGASGSGKTTLLLMSAAMLRPTLGTVRIQGRSLYEMSGAERSKTRHADIATILPLFHLLPYVDAIGNVIVASRQRGGRNRAESLLKGLGLEQRMRHRPEKLSSGERRRVMVARALMNKAPLLLADEPTANLDEANAEIVRGAIRQHVSDGGGALVVTHEPADAYNATRAYTMSSGKMSRQGRASGWLIAVIASVIMVCVLGWVLFKPERNTASSAEPIVLACAAGIKPAVEAAIARYEEESRTTWQGPARRVVVTYGGSGTLLGQLTANPDGADLYLAADDSYIEKAEAKQLTAEALPVATMKPVIAVAKGNPKGIQTLNDLLNADLKVGLGNPEAAAIGNITQQVFSDLGLWDEMSAKVKVLKPTVNELAGDLAIGKLDAAIIWDATASQVKELDSVAVPELDQHQRDVTIAVVATTKRSADSLHFARYLAAPDRGGEAFQEFGYGEVDGDAWDDYPKLLVYAGTMFNLAVDNTINDFEKREGVQVERVYQGCGMLVSQMKAGGNPDAYLACHDVFMDQVESRFRDSISLSENDVIIITQKGNPHDIRELSDLLKPDLSIGLSHPTKSALGYLTQELLKQQGLVQRLTDSGNWKQDSPQGDFLVGALRTGALDAAVVYRSNAQPWLSDLEIIDIELPTAVSHQPAAVAIESKQPRLAQRLLDAIRTQESAERFRELGFTWLADDPPVGD